METSAKTLDFLLEGVEGEDRDAVTRAYYEFAQGDPKSYPVNLAVLLTAAARQVAYAPHLFAQERQILAAALLDALEGAKQLNSQSKSSLDQSNKIMLQIQQTGEETTTLARQIVALKRGWLIGIIASALLIGLVIGYCLQPPHVARIMADNGFKVQMQEGAHPTFWIGVPTTYHASTDEATRVITLTSKNE